MSSLFFNNSLQEETTKHKHKSKQRWYKIHGDKAYVYDSPHEEYAKSVSIIDIEDLQYYRNNLALSKLWTVMV